MKGGTMKNKFFTFTFLAVFLASLTGINALTANAATVDLELRPAAQTVNLGDPVAVEVYFAGDQFYATSDISITFDSTILSFNSWSPGTSILAYSSSTAFPMSESAPFGSNLPDTGHGLLLATVNFTATALGTSPVDIGTADLLIFTASTETGFGEQFTGKIGLKGGAVTVVPIPGALLLLGSGLVGLFGFRRWAN